MSVETFTSGPLTLDVEETETTISVRWKGKSTAREPGPFLVPLLSRCLNSCIATERKLELDFRAAEYFNSSTITPIIRVLDSAKHGLAAVRVIYNKSVRWQAISFSALLIFQGDDGRITIEGV